jgi:uncharacterized protein
MPMEVRVRDVKRWAGRRMREPLGGDPPEELVRLSDWPIDGQVSGDVVVDNGGDFLAVRLSGEVVLRAECARCLKPFSLPVAWELTQEFREDVPGPDDEWNAYREDVIPLDPLITEAVLLATPPAPLCHPDCRGLCSQCGQDLNLGPCTCEPFRDPRWSGLGEWGGGARGSDASTSSGSTGASESEEDA